MEPHAITALPPDKHPQQPALLISELMQRYTTTRLADGAWKEHSLKDHTNRLENLVYLLGDKEAVTVTRDDMRELRDILRKLPPSRKKSPKYRGKSIAEIFAMSASLKNKECCYSLDSITATARAACAKAGVSDLRLHDLYGTKPLPACLKTQTWTL